MNDKDNIKLSDLSVTDLDDMDWDKYTLIVQCDSCNTPVNLDDEGIYVSETKVYCKDSNGSFNPRAPGGARSTGRNQPPDRETFQSTRPRRGAMAPWTISRSYA